MKGLIKSVFPFVIVFSMLFSGCAGASILDNQVIPAQLGTTLWMMKQAVQGGSTTMIMAKDNLYLFMGAVEGGWVFSVIDAGKKAPVEEFSKIVGSGNFANAKTMGDLASFLKEHGWKIVTASEIPQVISAALGSAGSWLSNMATSMTSFVVLPAGVFIDPADVNTFATWE
jgi:hypothetical protein